MNKILFSLVLICVIFVISIVSAFIILRPVRIHGLSMEPTYPNQSYFLVNKFAYVLGKPKQGDVVLYIPAEKPQYEFLGRVIALPGEILKIENNQIFIDNSKLTESYLTGDEITIAGVDRNKNFITEGEDVKIPEDSYFIMGDNRDRSADSRSIGFVPVENIKGKFLFKYWPPANPK